MTENQNTKCCFTAVIGAPNAGKSTLINNLVGAKVSIVTPKAQTTRNRIRGITIHDNCQHIFVDTPGIFKPTGKINTRLNRSIVETAKNSLEGQDVLAFIFDCKSKINENTKHIISQISENNCKKILIINKIDLTNKETLLDLSARLNELADFDRTFMISAKKGDYVADILQYLTDVAGESPWHYPEDVISDLPMKNFASEITREKIFFKLREEIPYNIFVDTETYEEDERNIKINQAIYVSSKSHKQIILGAKGENIKSIGQSARLELSSIMEKKVHLYLFVKVRENWMENKENYITSGIDFAK